MVSRTISVYDANRYPPEWDRLLTGSEVAVFGEDAHQELPVRSSTGVPTCEIFDDERSAAVHCKERSYTESSASLLVFDERGRSADPIAVYESPTFRTREIC